MAFIPIPNTARITLEYSFNGQIMVNVYWASKSTPLTTVDLTNILNIFQAWRTTQLRNRQHTSCLLNRLVAVDQTTQFSPSAEVVLAIPEPGLLAGDPAPGNVTVATTLLTALRGRAFRGRSFLLGVSEAEANANEYFLAGATALTASYVQLITDLSAGGYQFAVGSRQLNGVPRVVGVATPITGAITEVFLDSQRRRLTNRGQ